MVQNLVAFRRHFYYGWGHMRNLTLRVLFGFLALSPLALAEFDPNAPGTVDSSITVLILEAEDEEEGEAALQEAKALETHLDEDSLNDERSVADSSHSAQADCGKKSYQEKIEIFFKSPTGIIIGVATVSSAAIYALAQTSYGPTLRSGALARLVQNSLVSRLGSCFFALGAVAFTCPSGQMVCPCSERWVPAVAYCTAVAPELSEAAVLRLKTLLAAARDLKIGLYEMPSRLFHYIWQVEQPKGSE